MSTDYPVKYCDVEGCDEPCVEALVEGYTEHISIFLCTAHRADRLAEWKEIP